jgi:hypothetical protein
MVEQKVLEMNYQREWIDVHGDVEMSSLYYDEFVAVMHEIFGAVTQDAPDHFLKLHFKGKPKSMVKAYWEVWCHPALNDGVHAVIASGRTTIWYNGISKTGWNNFERSSITVDLPRVIR